MWGKCISFWAVLTFKIYYNLVPTFLTSSDFHDREIILFWYNYTEKMKKKNTFLSELYKHYKLQVLSFKINVQRNNSILQVKCSRIWKFLHMKRASGWFCIIFQGLFHFIFHSMESFHFIPRKRYLLLIAVKLPNHSSCQISWISLFSLEKVYFSNAVVQKHAVVVA